MCVEEENNTNSSNVDGSGSEKEKPQLVNILDKQFEFHYAFHPVVEQEKLYTQTTKPLLSKFFEGYADEKVVNDNKRGKKGKKSFKGKKSKSGAGKKSHTSAKKSPKQRQTNL